MNIDPVEFYEKYWRLEDGSKPPPLSDWDKDFLRNAHLIASGKMIMIRGRQAKRTLLSQALKELESLKNEVK
jgi:hypothetical protein